MSDVLDWFSEALGMGMTIEELDALREAQRASLTATLTTIPPADVNPNGSQEHPVEWPRHYNQGKIQPIDFIDDQELDFYQGQIVKYVIRWREKNGMQDLEKALWYLQRYIGIQKSKRAK
jgi:hypothetical protein